MRTLIKEQIFVSHWLQIPSEARQKLAIVFGLGKSGFANVVNNVVVSDGYSDKDLTDITIDKLQNYIGSGFTSKTGIVELLEMAVVKVMTPEPVKIVSPTPEVSILPKEEAKQARKEYEAKQKKLNKKVVKRLGKKSKK
jgi:hypothetical protein